MLLALPVQAQQTAPTKPLPVLELFTSQGCSSCPTADALFARYARRTDIVALSLPVDYWDYLGWKDTLASPKFSKRQREYAARRGDGEVFTPQVIVNGTVKAVGSDESAIATAVEKASASCKTSPVTIALAIDGNTMHISLDTRELAPAEAAKGTVWVAVVEPEVPVTIARGENRGKTVTYFNVVRELIPVGLWSGESSHLSLDRAAVMNVPGARSAVLVQQGKGGPIVAAGWFQ